MDKGIKGRTVREKRRRKFVKRAGKKKKRWFSAAFRGKRMDCVERWDRAAGRICSFFLWVGLGLLMLVFSWELFWRTGEVSVSEDRLCNEDYGRNNVYLRNEDRFTGNSGTAEGEESEKGKEVEKKENREIKQEEGWSGEIFGIEIQIRNGKIVFFREKTRIEEESVSSDP